MFLNNYIPISLYLAGTLVGLGVLFLIRKTFFDFEETLQFFFTDFTTLVKNLFLSVVVFGTTSFWFFEYVNERLVDSADAIYIKCKVFKVYIVSAGSSNTIDFDFFGNDESIDNFNSTELMRQANKEGNYEKYFLNLTIKKGLLTSYILEDYSFVIEN
jgi:hypothetical protein